MKEHTCQRPRTCCCSVQGLEPHDDCPIHSGGEWPPRCEVCGRLMPWPKKTGTVDCQFGVLAERREDGHDLD